MYCIACPLPSKDATQLKYSRSIAGRLRKEAAAHVCRQVVADGELGPQHTVGLGVTATLVVAGIEVPAHLTAERVDDRLDISLFIGQQPFFRQRIPLVDAAHV